MSTIKITWSLLPIAVRVYPEPPKSEEENEQHNRKWRCPEAMFVFDTETRTDATQRLLFGSYRFIVSGRCLEEGLIHPDDLSEDELSTIKGYVAKNRADTVADGDPNLLLLTVPEFLDRLFRAAYKGRCVLVGFNLPFDLARVARGHKQARGRYAGGFALELWSYTDEAGNEQHNTYRPRIVIKHIDSKRALKGFTSRKDPDEVDRIPEGSETGKPEKNYNFRGHFLDLRTLAFALTDRGYTLKAACRAFGVEHGKTDVPEHGVLTEEYIDYNRRDVLATAELAAKLLEEYSKHPIALQPTKAYSPASIGKAYLHSMGIAPILQRQPEFPKEYLGYAETAFFGGRTSAHIRKVPVPVVYTDFLSMYPTVNSLMGLWRFVRAREIRVVEHCVEEITALLKGITKDALFNPETWKGFAAFVKIVPSDDILPSRSKYNADTNDWQVAVNYLSGDTGDTAHELWFSLPDVITSVLLTDRAPKIIDAFRLEPVGTMRGLKSVKLRGAITVDPRREDFFKVVIEQRKSLASRTELSDADKARLDKALKVLANSTSYGIYAEMNRQESDKEVTVVCHGIDRKPYPCPVAHPEAPGEYCFPPMASLITGGARLMLALLDRSVSDLGGTRAMEDTDSMAIVSTEHGGLVPCPGGPERMPNGEAAVKALSWSDVHGIAKRFESLNPYDSTAIRGSVLKIEDDNYEGGNPKMGKQRQLFCLAISAKRYALFIKDEKGNPILLRDGVNNTADRWSEHGLGHLLNPTDPESEDREWIAQVWLGIIRRALGLRTEKLPCENVPAVGRISISSPTTMNRFEDFNAGKKYRDQIKPFNFLLTCHVAPLGHPTGVDPERFHLITRYETDSRLWLKTEWIDQYSGKHYFITTAGYHGDRRTARVKTYGDVILEYEYHAEAKCADAEELPSDQQTIGLLQRRHVHIEFIRPIGKESNSLEEVDAGLIHEEVGAYTEYTDPARDEWQLKTLPVVKTLPLPMLVKETGLSERALQKIRAGRRPHPKNQELLTRIVRRFQSEGKLV
jgi:hypothetical protein